MRAVKSKKRLMLIIALAVLGAFAIIITIVFFVLPNMITFNESGILVEYTSDMLWYSSGMDQAYGIKIIINNDGTAEIINTPVVIRENKEIPFFSFTVNASVVAGLQDEIRETRFITLPRNLSTDALDGCASSITVYTQKKVYETGGANPSNERYCSVVTAIREAVPEDVMKEYEAAVDLYYSD